MRLLHGLICCTANTGTRKWERAEKDDVFNGYLTIFDGAANNGLGVVKFATAV
jgi:hypothetical protein